MTYVYDRNPQMDLVHSLRAVTVELDLAGARFAEREKMHATDLRALIQILDGNRTGALVTPGWLSRRMGITTAATTAVLDRLEGAGYVRRANDMIDRRRVMVVPNDEAIETGWKFFGPLIESMIKAFDGFSDAELDVVRRFLAAMIEVVAARPE